MSTAIIKKGRESLDYFLALKECEKDLVLTQGDIVKVTEGQAKLGDVVKGWFGYNLPTIEELFERQLKNVRKMNYVVQYIIHISRSELESLVGETKHVTGRLSTNVKLRKELKSQIGDYRQRVSELEQSLSELTPENDSYFNLIEEYLDAKREFLETKQKYELTNEAIVDFKQEDGFLRVVEDLLRMSLHICEKVAARSVRYEEHVYRTLRTYFALRHQREALGLLEQSVRTLSDYTLVIHDTLNDGINDLSELVVGARPTQFYELGSKNISALVSSLEKVKHLDTYEEEVNRYLKS